MAHCLTVKFSGRQSALRKQTKKTHEGIIPFVTTYHPAVKNLKQLLMQEWSLVHNQPMLKTFTKLLLSYHTEEGNHLNTYSLEQNFEGTYHSVATAKTRGEVSAGLSWSFLCFYFLGKKNRGGTAPPGPSPCYGTALNEILKNRPWYHKEGGVHSKTCSWEQNHNKGKNNQSTYSGIVKTSGLHDSPIDTKCARGQNGQIIL